jgi:hypothetical protein
MVPIGKRNNTKVNVVVGSGRSVNQNGTDQTVTVLDAEMAESKSQLTVKYDWK